MLPPVPVRRTAGLERVSAKPWRGIGGGVAWCRKGFDMDEHDVETKVPDYAAVKASAQRCFDAKDRRPVACVGVSGKILSLCAKIDELESRLVSLENPPAVTLPPGTFTAPGAPGEPTKSAKSIR